MNATYHGTKDLAEMDSIVARCAASILPYDPNDPMVPAITINNRAFDLLSRGLPLLYADLPGLLTAPEETIYRCATPEDYVSAFERAGARFAASQSTIQSFLSEHTADARYAQVMAVVERGRETEHRNAASVLAVP
jgi:hypothetical protein